ncbi:hypothetical protein CCP4SC76_6710017 [Gammaproteobacteria bacterium]
MPSSPYEHCHAEVAELVDALDSGSSGGNFVEVQVLSSAPLCLVGLSKTQNGKNVGPG